VAEVVYGLCALTSILCAAVLVRGYLASKQRMLLWASVGFVGFAGNNILLFLDLVIVPAVDLSLPRNVAALAGAFALLAGLILENP
jgi:hypothetical protein